VVPVQVMEVQEVAQRLRRMVDRHLLQIRAAAGAGADRDEAAHLQRLQRLAHRALRIAEELDQFLLVRQPVAGLLALGHDPALDVFDDDVRELLPLRAVLPKGSFVTLHAHRGSFRGMSNSARS
jgi:hypothetical protein